MSTTPAEPTDPLKTLGNRPHTRDEIPARIFLVSYPKIIFLYPTFLMSLIAGIVLSFEGDPQSTTAFVLTSLFLGIFAMNLVVFSFDFPRTTSLTLFFFVAACVLGMFLTFQFRPEWAGILKSMFGSIHPFANSTFFHLFSIILGGIYLVVVFNLQFDYWEARPNELLHHHGLWSDLERFPAPNLRISKEINDVFEYLLLRSGRLVLTPSNEPRAIVLDNVLFIDRKERALTRMLSALQVQVRTDP
ncbi:MAG: hypothetical protein V4719_07335 [Planctomycetota bacterium]